MEYLPDTLVLIGERVTQEQYEEFGRSGRHYFVAFSHAPGCGRVLIRLVRIVENIGDLPIDEREILPVRYWPGGSASS